jgi:drug/metabolite transporter (DMT)-like permease
MLLHAWLARLPWLAPYLACFFFAWMAICIRLLSDLPTAEVMFFRSIIPVLTYLPMVLANRTGLQLAWQHRQPLLMRGLAGTLSLYLYLVAIRSIPLADATLTSNTSPLWAALAAWLTLGEALNPRLLWAFPLSLVGVVLVAGSQVGGPPLGYLAGLASAALSGSAYAVIRKLRDLPPELISLAFMGLAALCAVPFMVTGYVAPTPQQWQLVAALGATGTLGQWFMTAGYRYNTAATAASLGLASVALTALLAFWLFHESLTSGQLLGMGLIVLGTLGATSKPDRPA